MNHLNLPEPLIQITSESINLFLLVPIRIIIIFRVLLAVKKRVIQSVILYGLLQILLLSLSFFKCNAQKADSIQIEISMNKLNEAKECFDKNKKNKCINLVKDACSRSQNHPFVLKEVFELLIKNELYEDALYFSNRFKISTFNNSQKSRFYFYIGLLNMNLGSSYFDEAHSAFLNALYWESRNSEPNSIFLSEIYNSLGVCRMIYGSKNNQPKSNSHRNWIVSDIEEALHFFKYSILFNDSNQIAESNFMLLLEKYEELGYDASEIQKLNSPRIKVDTTMEGFSIDFAAIDSSDFYSEKYELDTLEKVDLSFLPKNVNTIMTLLGDYDEIILVLDHSASMFQLHPVSNASRFDIMKEIALYVADKLPQKKKLGAISVGGQCGMPDLVIPINDLKRTYLINEIENLFLDGFTPLANSLSIVDRLYSPKKNKKAVFIISDGFETCTNPIDLCLLGNDLHSKGIDIHILSFIIPGMPDFEYSQILYNCMTTTKGSVQIYSEEAKIENTKKSEHRSDEFELRLPRIEVGKRLNLKYIEVFYEEMFFSKIGESPK